MARYSELKIFSTAFAIAALGSVGHAQALTSQPSAPATSPILAPAPAEKAPAPTGPKRTRPISGEVAAALAAASPKYTPPAPKPEPKPEAEQVDMRDVDKPKNGIVRLPKYIVQE